MRVNDSASNTVVELQQDLFLRFSKFELKNKLREE